MSEQLKPCPFCGGTELEVEDCTKFIGTPIPDKKIVCLQCFASSHEGLDAHRAWNTRADNQQLIKDLVDGLDRLQTYVDVAFPEGKPIIHGLDMANEHAKALIERAKK